MQRFCQSLLYIVICAEIGENLVAKISGLYEYCIRMVYCRVAQETRSSSETESL